MFPTAHTSFKIAARNATSPREDLPLRILVGLAAIISPLLYFLSDVIETAQGDFSTLRLTLTYLGEATIPLFVLGLYAVQRPRIRWLGLTGAVLYAYSFVFFTTTVVYALAAGTPNWDGVVDTFGGWLILHGTLMCLGGVLFGWATLRAAVLPRWTACCLIVGVILVAACSDLPSLARTIAAAFPDAAFIGMGVHLLRGCRPSRAAT